MVMATLRSKSRGIVWKSDSASLAESFSIEMKVDLIHVPLPFIEFNILHIFS